MTIRGNRSVGILAPVASAMAAGVLLVASGCRTAAPPTIDPDLVTEALPTLQRPLEGDPAALYRLRVPNAANLRLSLLVAGEGGRMTVSERFGSALSLTAWRGQEPPDHLDFREGCEIEGAELSQLVGVAVMPMPQAVRLLVGRLPTVGEERIAVRTDGRIQIIGSEWSAVVEVRPDPWRVVEVREGMGAEEGWTVTVSEHSGSVPSALKIRKPGHRWAELELIRLEWDEANELPPRPELPPCTMVEP